MNQFCFLLLLASIVHHGSMDLGSQDVILPVELVGPKHFVALGGNNLTIRYRLSPLVYNLTTPFALPFGPLSFQLFFLQGDGREKFVASQDIISTAVSYTWNQVVFECGLIVRGGYYSIRLVELEDGGDSSVSNDYDYMRTVVEVISNVTIRVRYPVIAFEVPHRLETYTTSVRVSFGLTRSLCEPKLPLPSTILSLSMCKQSDTEECTRDFVTILRDPLIRLQRDKQVTVDIECQFWGKNATYRAQIQESATNLVISKSQPIKVEWSSRFSLNLTIASILPCPSGKPVRVMVSYPSCALLEKDKVRVYGYESPVPSLLAINRLNYIGEKQIRPNRQFVTFSCSMFTPRFSRYCFQYISTAVDDSVSVVVEKCVPTFSPDNFVDGGWGSWSEWSPCSNTCGTKGKQFRYRFCDSPQPAFGANFCQGDSIEERSCDSILPECPIEDLSLSTAANDEMNSPQLAVETAHSFGFIPLHPSLNMNLSTTYGCECGCILDNILPGINYSLVVIISSNQSSCGDQDEEDHHHLKWILNAKEDASRIRMDVVDVDLHCMKLAFRDGNTSDSNLLDVFTSSRSRSDFQREQQLQGEDEREAMTITVESTGASLSIAASESNQNDCTFQFLYLVAYYQATTFTVPEKKLQVREWMVYDFWTFLILKLVLSFFVVIVVCSTFGGCATKVYHKYKYKQLKWSENEVDRDEAMENGSRAPENVSRCTSITLMSFDYNYWKRIRILRLKYFLLKPKPLNKKTAQVKSFPSTPTHLFAAKAKSKPTVGNSRANPKKMKKHQSLSETDLRRNSHPLLSTSGEADDTRRMINSESTGQTYKVQTLCPKHYFVSDPSSNMCEEERNEKYKLITSASACPKHRKGRPAFISLTVPDEVFNDKLRKEKENMKRQQGSEGKESTKKLKKIQNNFNRQQTGGEELAMKVILQRDKGKSQISVATIHSLARLSSSGDTTDSQDRVDVDDADQDFEMDYYDYDVLNAGNIPGSYLGLEPAFVLWNSEMYPNEDPDDSSFIQTEHDDCSSTVSIEMTEPKSYSFKPELCQTPSQVKETSLQTLRFVDDEDDFDDDGENTQASDSLLNHDNDTDHCSLKM
ncbi:unnamed protein product [Allacma fusca]|uniref:Thrombospondin type-1 domain-containing protein 1 n=1 Tax=Allacma fusca TaxID=39272 RepID=A0A8J2JJR3_9HEXA|nr:unnamed protein product [Allacma fusca]